jgi:hypothetical protein
MDIWLQTIYKNPSVRESTVFRSFVPIFERFSCNLGSANRPINSQAFYRAVPKNIYTKTLIEGEFGYENPLTDRNQYTANKTLMFSVKYYITEP